ncbi:MAG TPA: hypothetical protein VNC22_04560, partial [Sporichthya sp.]|nr:hypothetical protein [Sporichthya sp.]
DARVGILVRHRGRAVIARGTAHLVDPLAGRGLGSLLRPDLPFTALGYLARNERRVIGTLLDGPSATLPLTRTALRIELTAVALLDAQGLHAHGGPWPEPTALLAGDLAARRPDLADVPPPLRSLLDADAAAVLGWHTADGPAALPARWRGDGSVTVPPGALELVGALSAAPACLTVQRSGHRISSVRGLMLAGPGRARSGDGPSTVRIDADRVSWWSGEESGTVKTTADISPDRIA